LATISLGAEEVQVLEVQVLFTLQNESDLRFCVLEKFIGSRFSITKCN